MSLDDCAKRRLCQRLLLSYAFPVPKLSIRMSAVSQWLKNVTISKLVWILATVLISNCLMIDRSFGITEQKILNTTSNHHPKLQILLPLYIYPNWYDKNKYAWKQVIAAAKKVSIIAIINPNSGPNNAPPNTDYQQGIKDLHQAGIKVVGYVPSNYSNRDIQAVKIDIDLYTKYFQIDGIFIDEAASSIEKASYYQQLYKYIKSKSIAYKVIINPGVNLEETYISQGVADTIITFENYQKNWSSYAPVKYQKNYPSQQFAALVHTTANRKLMKSTLDRAVKNNLGYIYITNDSTNTPNKNPWDTLPEYWQSEVNYIQQLNSSK
jgi:Spherulation-specific family 4